MTKTVKLALSFIDDDIISYADLCKELFEMQYLSAKACNRMMSYLYANKQQEFAMLEREENIPNPQDLYGKSLKGYVYDKLKEAMPTSYSGNVSQTQAFVLSQFATDIKKGLLKGDVSLTNFRRNGALHMVNKAYSLFENDKGIGIELSLFNKPKSKELGLKTGKLSFMIPKVNKYQKSILLRMMSGEYKQGAASLSYNRKKKKWMIALSFTFDEKECTGENTLIVRLDSEVLMRLQVKNESTQKLLKMKEYDDIVPGLEELQHMQKKMFAMRKAYGNATRIASANNVGKGYKKRAEKLLELGNKEARFRDTFNHKISRYIIDIAKRYNCGLIQLEDFSKIENVAFGDWTYYDLENKIVYKAKENGIDTMEVTTADNESAV
jgi:IS605 OrfB family transposase